MRNLWNFFSFLFVSGKFLKEYILNKFAYKQIAEGAFFQFVPLIIQLCVKVVEHHGLSTVGVYRIPGNTAAVNSLISSLDKGFENVNRQLDFLPHFAKTFTHFIWIQTDFNDPRWRDVNVVSSLLKAFLRKLPDPLLTDDLYQQFIDANRLPNHAPRLMKLREMVKIELKKYLRFIFDSFFQLEKLPRANYETLKFLTLHLRKVVAHSHINKVKTKKTKLDFILNVLFSRWKRGIWLWCSVRRWFAHQAKVWPPW